MIVNQPLHLTSANTLAMQTHSNNPVSQCLLSSHEPCSRRVQRHAAPLLPPKPTHRDTHTHKAVGSTQVLGSECATYSEACFLEVGGHRPSWVVLSLLRACMLPNNAHKPHHKKTCKAGKAQAAAQSHSLTPHRPTPTPHGTCRVCGTAAQRAQPPASCSCLHPAAAQRPCHLPQCRGTAQRHHPLLCLQAGAQTGALLHKAAAHNALSMLVMP